MPGVAQNTVDALQSQAHSTFVPVMLHGGNGLILNKPEPEPMQPFVSVTVTEYVPATLTLMDCVLLVNPPGPVQL